VWKGRPFPDFADGTVMTSPACVDGRVYFGSSGWKVETEGGHRTNTFLSCLSADDGSVVWNFEVGGQVETTPVVLGGRVYFGSEDGFFYCLE
jgi:outer membrane protein assembly factor BamB